MQGAVTPGNNKHMKQIIFFILLLMPAVGYGQDFSVSVAPYSFKFWGAVDGATSVGAEYKLSFLFNSENSPFYPPVAGVHYFHQWDKRSYLPEKGGSVTKTSSLVFSIIPVNVKYARLGGIVAQKNFPLSRSPRAHFYLQAVIPFGRFDIRYTHISNGFGILHDINPGLDTLSLHIHF